MALAPLLALTLGFGTPVAAAAPRCAQASVEVALPSGTPLLDWSENLVYDAQGNLWVARLYRNEVQRYDAAGALTARVPVEAPGAPRFGPDGLLYVNSGDSLAGSGGAGSVVRFDPAAPNPETFATGLTMPNGAAFDAEGYLYVAAGSGVVRIRRDGSIDRDWTDRAVHSGVNGIVVQGDALLVSANGGPLGQILRIPIADPGAASVVAQIPSPVPGVGDFADDMILDAAGTLTVTTISGQLVRVDPRTGATCTILRGEPMTSAAARPDRPGELLVGTESGNILRIHLPEA
ncbi:hypothetical protein D5S18_01765 [Nocardia panacis]|uniref:SMP-30/Gluconolactonase/LRE-like region domain-containing protein n=1 Tax=Nocardia panacis TaxID=2340916 RepID=A0A3A4KD35_9NOCA|nr:hypothetical protein D5S18_01765 [Nocardia panacis]